MAEKQVKSRKRVADHGEVFTAEREVNAMLDLVQQETQRVDSRFLEPACGDGNFLAEILRRKLEAARRQATPPRKKRPLPAAFEKQSVIAVMSLYGVDILMDNVEACRARLYQIWDEAYTAHCGAECREECQDAVRFILGRNILCGNALTLKKVNAAGEDTSDPIIFSEWVFTGSSSVKRSDYRLDVLMNENPDAANYHAQPGLFDQPAQDAVDWMIDPETGKRMPKPIRQFPPRYYWSVQNNG